MAPYRYRHESPFKAARRRGGRRRSRSVDEESLIGLVRFNRFSSDSLPSHYSQLSANKPLSGQRLNYDAKQADLSVRGHNGNDPGKTTPGDEERDKAAPLAAIDQANSDTFNSIVRPPVLSKRLLIGWRICILLPFLAAGCLLYLLTCSAPSWRSDWSVVKVKLEKNEWTPIYQHGKMLSAGGENIEIADQEGGSTTEDGDNGRGGGWLSVNMWGWCLQDASASETICSGENMWFDLDELLGEESRSSAPSGDDFNFLLTHGLVIHGFGMLAAMMALIPIGLNPFRMIRAKDPTVQSSWFEHGTILVACALCLASYIIDRCLKSSVADNLTNHTVKSGLANTITGTSALLLGLCFLLSGIPPLHFHMKRQRQLLKYWKNLEDYDQAIIISREAYSNEISGKADAEEAKRKKKRARARSKRSKAYRMTRMIFGYDDDGNVDDHGRYLEDLGGERTSGGDGLRRRGTISRWRSRRRGRREERRRRSSIIDDHRGPDPRPKRRGTISRWRSRRRERRGDRGEYRHERDRERERRYRYRRDSRNWW